MELYHYGIRGMRWGIRRFQKKDGTLTPKGKERYQGSRGDIEKEYKDKDYQEVWDSKLFGEIVTKSGDTYDREGTGKNFKEALKYDKQIREKYDRYRPFSNYSKVRKLTEERFASAILRDLDYNDTEAGRKFLIDHDLVYYN